MLAHFDVYVRWAKERRIKATFSITKNLYLVPPATNFDDLSGSAAQYYELLHKS